ncbi:ANTAR domain-containing protein [Streptomyces sp. S.PB5]|uniref:ANTAR domain-containing protein n=1 Tax=Streptomyces sp. S.PB5 TaxID=3020844 RepID=UPI0025B2077B|nr:ANTAR domain-containing protein [Streptomyces sp. S.PB5]MDN3020399.1 ANTAR domain-containing protein [Streptomyces sp. S.PB5]
MPNSARCCGGPSNGCTSLTDQVGSPRLTICARPDGERTLVTVSGDLDLSADAELQQALRSALTASAKGIDLDLAGVDFCDCSGLNALLAIRQQALDESKTATIHAISPAAGRVFALTGTLSLFDPEGEVHQRDDASHPSTDPRVEVVQLRRAMQTRGLIDLARGILMATFSLSAEEAWTVLVMTSQNTNTKLHRTARQLVDSVRGEPLPAAPRRHLSAAVTHVTAVRDRTDDEGAVDLGT